MKESEDLGQICTSAESDKNDFSSFASRNPQRGTQTNLKPGLDLNHEKGFQQAMRKRKKTAKDIEVLRNLNCDL